MKIVDKVEIHACSHIINPQAIWLENEEGKAPQFLYAGFPGEGVITLSKKTLIVGCERCWRRYGFTLFGQTTLSPEQ